MDQHPKQEDSGSSSAGNNAEQCHPASKWAVLLNDEYVPAPQRKVRVTVLKAQGGVPKDHTLFRDVSPAGDVPFKDDDVVDLAEGNVFYSRKGCFEPPVKPCAGKPKLAWFVDDRPEETLVAKQTGRSIRELFSLKDGQCLLRDFDSPEDRPIEVGDELKFSEGPVLNTRCDERQSREITITINTRKKTVSKMKLTYEEVIDLAFEKPPSGQNVCITVSYRRGPACNQQGTMVQGGTPVKIQCGMIFDVSATDKS